MMVRGSPHSGRAERNHVDSHHGTGYSRRRFLGRVGASAGALTLGGVAGGTASAGAAPAQPAETGATPSTNTFGRIFPNLPPFANATESVQKSLLKLGAPGGILDAQDKLSAGPVALITDPSLSVNNPNNPTHTAGTHFMGQFMDHDVT